jgi:hypothetical protein
MSDELTAFVAEGLRRGLPRQQLGDALLQAGWSDEQVRRALSGYADVEFPVPVPRPRPYVSAREMFLYLVLFTTLFISAYQLGSLAFDLINLARPDPADQASQFARAGIRWSVSSLFVAFPIFCVMTWRAAQLVQRDPAKRESKIRRTLTYLTLFVAACVLIGDVTVLVYNLLGGELTMRFALKVVVAAVIAGGVFLYYVRDVRDTVFVPAAAVVVIAAMAGGVYAVGRPATARDQQLDARRVSDLQEMQRMVDLQWSREQRLPDLPPLSRDPESGQPYEYRVLSENRYELCAVFTGSSREANERPPGDFWTHDAGRQCFEIEARRVLP